jgi:hypothetical protein
MTLNRSTEGKLPDYSITNGVLMAIRWDKFTLKAQEAVQRAHH